MSDEGFPPLQNDFAIREEEEEEEETNNKSGIVEEEEEAEEGENNFSSLVTHLGGVRGIFTFFPIALFPGRRRPKLFFVPLSTDGGKHSIMDRKF